jgi:hypothetical protein
VISARKIPQTMAATAYAMNRLTAIRFKRLRRSEAM